MTTKRSLKLVLFLTFLCGIINIGYTQNKQKKHTISGYIYDKNSGEMLGDVSVLALPDEVITSSNKYGFFSQTLNEGPKLIIIKFPGFQLDSILWSGKTDTAVNIYIKLTEMTSEFDRIEEVVIKGKKNTIADKAQMSQIDIPINQIKEIPALLGEKDVLKVIQLLPGVQKGGEGQSGIYVRGGGPDQNLLILDEAIVYNASHLFGFFSVFNGDALKSVELVKGGFPAKYGGRLSSVIDLTMKEGNNQRLTGEVGIGVISSRFTLEGPIKKGKSSFMISGRRTYLDILVQPFIMASNDGSTGGYYFYDFNAKANYILSTKDKLFISGYFGKDNFYTNIKEDGAKLESDFGWGNRTLTARWNHQFSPKLFSNASLIYSHYNLLIGVGTTNASDTFLLNYQSIINDYGIKYDFDWRPLPNHTVRYGISSIWHRFQPGAVVIEIGQESVLDRAINTINTYESGIYIEDQFKYDKFNIYPGFRISHYSVEGKNYIKPEPRFSASYAIRKDLSVKASYAHMYQYIHLLSSSGISLPTDLWVPATKNISPMRSTQVAAGIAKDFDGGYSISVEGYYKDMADMIQYKDGASFLLQEDIFDPTAPTDSKSWENQVTRGIGWSYGAELFIQKKVGRFSGWIGYTLSWTKLKFDELNYGKVFYARYDRRHDLSLVGIYKLAKNFTASATWVYGSGNAITAAQGYFPTSGHSMSKFPIIWNPQLQFGEGIDYGSRNSFRMEAYHRLDLGLQFHKKKKNGMQTWEFSAYNAYNQANPFFYYGSYENNGQGKAVQKLKKVTLFPIIPSISYTYKFN
jgi:hypothetical protein